MKKQEIQNQIIQVKRAYDNKMITVNEWNTINVQLHKKLRELEN